MSGQGPLTSVNNAIRVLNEFTFEGKELGITELSNRLGLAKSTVFRLVNTLGVNNLVEKNVLTNKYHLGIGAFELGFAAYHINKLAMVAYPLLKKLITSTREVAHIGVYDQGEIIILCKRVPENHTGTISKIGRRIPGHCTASGKILLAHQSMQEINKVINKGLTKYTDKTILEPDKMISQLRETRELGYAIAAGEYAEDIYSIAVPVFDDLKQVIAAISLATNKKYLYPNQVQNYVNELRTYSRLITEQMD